MTSSNSALRNKNYLEITYKNSKGTYPDKLAKHLLNHYYKKPGKLLDIGCGNGDFLRAFSKLGFEVVGVDISPDVVDRLGQEFDVRLLDIEDSQNTFDEELDFVFSKSVIEHMREPLSLFNLANNSLRTGGLAVIMCPSWEHTYWGPYYIDHTHVTPFTRPSLAESFRFAGFKKSDCFYFRQLPIVWKYFPLLVISYIVSKLPIPYAPWNFVPWSVNNQINKFVRFSKEVMLLGVGRK